MRSRLIIPVIVVLLVPFFAMAGGQISTRVRKSELKDVPFLAGNSIKITITRLYQGYLRTETGDPEMELQVENLSTSFVTFSPRHLSFVGSNNRQVDILAVQVIKESYPAVDRRLALGAHIKDTYRLSDKLSLPARLYYEEKLIALITD